MALRREKFGQGNTALTVLSTLASEQDGRKFKSIPNRFIPKAPEILRQYVLILDVQTVFLQGNQQ